jgi:hypothetical protein
MDGELRFYQRPWVYPFLWTVFWVGIYVWQIVRLGGFYVSLIYIIVDAFLFFLGMLIWLAFFAQFVLPVSKFRDRQKIFDRLLSHLTGSHGPAMFVENGIPRAGQGEKEKKGPGVIWLDSASAVQLRTPTKFTRTLGPGIHFTGYDESIAGAVDLHAQSQRLGPWDKDKPFEPKPESMSDGDYQIMQKRAAETRALTRDGIEVVPNINVTFKIDADPVEGDGPGSRFGYRETEKEEDNPVFKAIAGEGVNPNLLSMPREKQIVAWNRLPASFAADLWREYLSKFTLQDLFNPIYDIPPEQPPLLQPALHETTALYEPVQASAQQNAWQDVFAEILHELNHGLKKLVDWLEKHQPTQPSAPKSPTAHPTVNKKVETHKGTALEVIVVMVKARMTRPRVAELDEHGRLTGNEIESLEYKWLKNRGLKVNRANVHSLRFCTAVEDGLVRQWNATWLNNARVERDAIERRRKLVEMRGHESGLNDYARVLSRGLLREQPAVGRETVKNLILRSRSELVRADRLHRRLSTEIDDLDEILRWLER